MTVAGRGFLLASELGIDVPEKQVEDGILRVLRDQRLGNLRGSFVIAVIVAQVFRQIEAGFHASQLALFHGAFELPHPHALIAAGNPHEKSQDPGHGGKRIHVIIVEAEAGIGVREVRVKSYGAKEMLAGFHSGAGRGAAFVAQGQQPRSECIAHSGVKVHLGGFLFLQERLG